LRFYANDATQEVNIGHPQSARFPIPETCAIHDSYRYLVAIGHRVAQCEYFRLRYGAFRWSRVHWHPVHIRCGIATDAAGSYRSREALSNVSHRQFDRIGRVLCGKVGAECL
jgi:hypothetical protein